MKLRHIEVFHAIYLTGSVSAAARALNVSQPGMSKVLKHAEDSLGFKLFARRKGRLVPTEKGIVLFEQVEPVFNKFTELRSFARQLANNKKGRIRFAMTPAFGLEIGPKALAQFSTQNPDITIEVETLHSMEIIKALQKRTIDIGMIFGAPNIPGISTNVIGCTEFVCLAPIGYSLPSKDEIELRDIEKFPLITLNEKSVLGHLLANKLTEAFAFNVNSRIIVETYYIAKQLVRQNAGVAIIDKITGFSEMTSDVQFKNISNLVDIKISIVTRSDEPSSDDHNRFIKALLSVTEQFLKKTKR